MKDSVVMQRILIFVYGLIAYLLFLVTILYAIGFVGDMVVPKSINTGSSVGWGEFVLVNSALLMLFVLQHTIMARPAFKVWITRVLPKPMERSTFVILASSILLLLFWQWRPMPSVIWHIDEPVARAALHGFFFLGWFIVFFSSFLIDHFDLFGLRQVVLHLRGRQYTNKPFVIRSLYRFVRHPLMLGFLIAFWATPTMTAGHLFFAAMTTGYILFGTSVEERDLIRQHGQAYLDYRRSTPMLIPIPRLSSGRPPAGDSDAARSHPQA